MSAPAETSVPDQQPQQSVQQNSQAAPATPTVAGDSLTCQWSNCGERCATAEQLYDHVCERHVGRKSTNNLNLTCQWGSCRTTTVKRDHITSHIRVHVPLKPHKCDFCGKAFKRPQDLKKHVKTHADDSVLLRSPEPNRAQHGGGGYGQPGSGKLVADLQALAATATGYYPSDGMNPNAGPYHQNPGAQAAAAFYGNAPQNSAYGNVYYAVNQQGLNSDYEIRKRAAYDALNEFFGDAKRRIIDPATYYDVGARLAGLQGLQLPVMAGGYGGVSDYHGGSAAVVSPAHAAPPHQYSLPLPNLRTKSDLVNIDQFLDQLQTTVYENSNHAAAAGVAQAGAHYLHPSVNFRSSNSPPGVHGSAPQPGSSHATAAPLSAPQTETPALTPASSVLSYTSGQSPNSVHSSHTISPTSRTSVGSMYPTLPSVTAMSDMSSNYPATSSAAPSALASFNQDSRRRYSGGLLQKPAPDREPRSSDAMDTSDDQASTPREIGSRRSSSAPEVQRLSIQSPGAALDPSLRSPSQHSASSSDHNMSESMQESWVENIRLIERLRNYIKERLEHGEFDEDSPQEESAAREPNSDEHNLYPILRAVRDEE